MLGLGELVRRLNRQYIVCAACLALAAGTLVARVLPLHSTAWLWSVVPFVALSLRRHNITTLVLLGVLAFGVGWWRGSYFVHRLDINQSLYEQKVTIVGRATDDAVYGKQYQLEFSLSDARALSPGAVPIVGGITVRGFGEPVIYRGDIVRVTGKLFPTRGNNVASISYANLTVMQRDTSWVNDVRRKFAAGMQSALPEPLASFSLGLLIGQRSTLPDEVNDQLRRVGLTHIIAVSGANLTIIVTACRKLLAKRSKFQTMASCLLLLGLFLLMTGSCPPIVRASIISLLGLWAWYYGREISAIVLVLVGAAITVLANPLYLWGNVSWYLSFLSFFGVLIVGPLVRVRLYGDREPGLVSGVVLETLCASVLVIPYVLYIFGQTSLVSLPANILVVPLIPFAMLLGLAAGLAGMLLPVLAGWFAWPAVMLLTYMLDVSALLSRVPHAFVEHVGVSWQTMTEMYGIIGVVLIILRNKARKLRKSDRLRHME